MLEDWLEQVCTWEVELEGGPLDGEIMMLQPGMNVLNFPSDVEEITYRFHQDNIFMYVEKGLKDVE